MLVSKEQEEIMNKGRGDGQGQGGSRQGDGGASKCVCPDCGKEISHVKGTPCAKTACPDCGSSMVGKNSKGNKSLIVKIINHNIQKSEPSILINDSILINAPKVEKDIEVDNLLLTHCHSINLEGMDKAKVKNLYVLDTQKHLHFLDYHVKGYDQKYNTTLIKEYKNVEIEGLEVMPIIIKHQVQEIYGDDCLGFIFNKKVAYISPCHRIPKKSMEYLKGIDVLIIDGGYKKKELYQDHKSIYNTLKEFKDYGIKHIYFLGTFKHYKIQGTLKGTTIKVDTLFKGDILKIGI